jgi:excisionase family DNA binding protein
MKEDPQMDQPVTVKIAAKLTGVHPRTIQKWVEKGAVRAFETPGGRLRVVPRDCLPRPRAPRSTSA